MVTPTLQPKPRRHKKITKKPTKKEVQALVNTINDLLFHSNAHLRQTIQEPGQPGSVNIFGKKLYSWGNLNAAIHRTEQMLEARKDS